jgi:hypothetical protein
MKKLFLTLTAILCCCLTIMAEPVSPQTAQQAAAKFLNKKGSALKSEAMRAKHNAQGTRHNAQSAAAMDGAGNNCELCIEHCALYYVFNASQGFVVVSGDDCVGDNLVLGYAEQGSFDAEDIPDNLQWWLDKTANQISTLSQLGVKARRVALHDDIAPMLTSRWDQGFPYNAYCPMTDGKQCLTGCMATALSQVMYYHRWPQGPIAEALPTYTMENGRVIDGLPVTSFDWDNMVDNYKTTTTEAQQAAVATLMRYCGQMIQMDYTPQISNGILYDIDIIVNTFGYAPGLYLAQANDYTVGGWDELLYNELHEGRPLVYLGQSTGGGHAFVIDGYEVQDGEGYFSVNWGWAGTGNGFFKINLLDPDMSGSGGSTTKDGYSISQAALIGLQPQKGASEHYYRYLNSFAWDSKEEDSEHSFVIVNPSYLPGTFTIALAELGNDGTPDLSSIYASKDYEFTGFRNADLEHNGSLTFPLTNDLFGNLTPGRHNLVFVNREAGSSAPWKQLFGPNCRFEVNVGETGEVASVTIHPVPQLAASGSDIKIDGVKQRGLTQKVTATIHNNGTEDYVGGIECGVYYVEDGELKSLIGVTKTGIMAEAGGSSDVFFNFSVPMAGEYVLILSKIGDGKDISGSKLADIAQAPGYLAHTSVTYDELAFYCQYAEYSEHNDDNGNPVYLLDLVIANGTPMDYDAVVLVKLYKPNTQGGYDPIVFPAQPNIYAPLQLSSDMWQAFSILLAEPLESGEYGLELLIANDFHSRMPDDYFVFAGGPLTVTSTTGIAETVLNNESNNHEVWYTLDGRKIFGKPTTKGLYIYKGKKVVIK